MQTTRSASWAPRLPRSASDTASTVSMPLVEAGAEDAHGDLAAVRDQDARDAAASVGSALRVDRRRAAGRTPRDAPFSARIARTSAGHGRDDVVHQLHHLDDGQRVLGGHARVPTSTNGGAPGDGATARTGQPTVTRSASRSGARGSHASARRGRTRAMQPPPRPAPSSGSPVSAPPPSVARRETCRRSRPTVTVISSQSLRSNAASRAWTTAWSNSIGAGPSGVNRGRVCGRTWRRSPLRASRRRSG